MAELKPCPFCGCDKIRLDCYDPYDGYQGDLSRYKIWCDGCGANNERRNKEAAIEVWNRRAEDGK